MENSGDSISLTQTSGAEHSIAVPSQPLNESKPQELQWSQEERGKTVFLAPHPHFFK